LAKVIVQSTHSRTFAAIDGRQLLRSTQRTAFCSERNFSHLAKIVAVGERSLLKVVAHWCAAAKLSDFELAD
jgi:hypothetical protein